MRRAPAAIVIALLAAALPAFAKQPDIRKQAAAPAVQSGQITSQRAQNSSRSKAARSAPKGDNELQGAILAALDRSSDAIPNFPDSVGWRLIEDPATGARLGLPETLVPRASASRIGSRWSSAQGQIQIETFRLAEAALPALFEDEKKTAHRQVEASVVKPDLFVMSGVQGLKNFFMRAEAHGSEVRGMTVLYDQATEGTMERIALAMVAAYTAFPDLSAPAPPGLRRAVDYGTAIAVTKDGNLVASARLTDRCGSISVPGLGHAERIAADSVSDLALIRLYGAHNLTPVVVNGDGRQRGDLRLIGVAAPLAQNGDGLVSSSPAQIKGSDIEPAPAPGFAGAAAVDARGVFTGMVDLKPPVLAAANAGPARETATLVPVDSIRAFLQAHGVSPATAAGAPAPAEQSVVRIICVRK
jgi:hypothetical protein